MNIKKYIIFLFPYILLFWLFLKIGESYRMSASEDILNKIFDAVSNIDLLSAPALYSQDILIGLIGATTVYGVIYYKKKNAKKWRKDMEYGSARWGKPQDIKPTCVNLKNMV